MLELKELNNFIKKKGLLREINYLHDRIIDIKKGDYSINKQKDYIRIDWANEDNRLDNYKVISY